MKSCVLKIFVVALFRPSVFCLLQCTPSTPSISSMVVVVREASEEELIQF